MNDLMDQLYLRYLRRLDDSLHQRNFQDKHYTRIPAAADDPDCRLRPLVHRYNLHGAHKNVS